MNTQRPNRHRYRFGDVDLDLTARSIHVRGQVCSMEPKSFDLLTFLIENRGRAVTKSEIIANVWPNTFVTDNSIARAVTKLRKALADYSKEPRYIETVPTIGYRFIAACTIDEPQTQNSSSQSVSIAILPIANHTGDPTLEYVADGFTGAAIRLLSELPNLKVIARSSVYRFKHLDDDPCTFSRSLGVNAVLIGRLHRLGDRLVLDVELLNVEDETVVISRQHWLNTTEWMDIQADLVLDVAQHLQLDLDRRQSGCLASRPTINSEAYQCFLRGEFLARRVVPATLHQALELFQEAVRLDNHFATAWAEAAQCQLLLGLYFENPRIRMPLAKQAAQRALELDESLQAAHASLGIVHLVFEWNYPEAEKELATAAICRRAIMTLACTAHLLAQTGRGHDAERQIRHTLEFDPRNPVMVAELGCNDYYRCRYDDAIGHFSLAAELDPQSLEPYWGLGRCYGQTGRYEEALVVLREFRARWAFEPPVLTAEIGYVLGSLGRKQEALDRAHQLEADSAVTYVDPYFVCLIYLGIGDRDKCFEWLEKAHAGRSPFVVSIPTEPKWRTLRDDPRFQRMLGCIGFGRPPVNESVAASAVSRLAAN